jgi:hypothetical protein
MAAAPQDGPSRPLGLEIALAAGILVVIVVVIGVATIGSIGALAIPYLLLSFLPGLVLWVPLLIGARRLTRERSISARVLASAAAAIIAIALNAAIVLLVTTPLGSYWGLYVAFAFVASIVFLIAALVAAFVVHLGASAARRPR